MFLGVLIVTQLTACHSPLADGDIPKSQQGVLWKFWKSEHDRIARLSSRDVDIVVPGAIHFIPHDAPQQVISAIDQVIREARPQQ